MKTSDKGLASEGISTILDSINDGVFTVDADWRVTSFNRAAEEITGVSRDEAVGEFCWEVFHASICEASCALRQTMETGQPVANRAVYIVNTDGKRVPIGISTALLKDEDGKVIGGVETFRDLTLVEELRKEISGRYTFADIISRNAEMHRLFDILPQVANSDTTILVEGESGTGKELFARAIHDHSPRSTHPFIAVNCAALPDTLLESELFGHKAGAFTDAKHDKPGRFALAEGGTLFLDEIGDISPAMQVRLLRVLQEKTYEPLGATKPRRADVRVLAATNKNLDRLVEDGTFRQDLYYRIDVLRLTLPPLRNRQEDIPLLIDYFVSRFNRIHGKDIVGVSPRVIDILTGHEFPGNVRELQNVIEHAFVLCRGSLIQVEHVPEHLREMGNQESAHAAGTLEQAERQLIVDALVRNQWNRLAASRDLGIHKSTLFRKIKSLNISLPSTDGRSSRH